MSGLVDEDLHTEIAGVSKLPLEVIAARGLIEKLPTTGQQHTSRNQVALFSGEARAKWQTVTIAKTKAQICEVKARFQRYAY